MNKHADSFICRITRIIAICGILLLFFTWLAYLCGARINRTHSLPTGLYWVVDKPPERGDIVLFWPQDTAVMREARQRGYLISGAYNQVDGKGYGLLLKQLMGMAGDIISITEDGVFINGALVPNSRPLTHDNLGDPLPMLRIDKYRLQEGEALFMSEYLPLSFDGRYFGVQELRQIVEVVQPVWVW